MTNAPSVLDRATMRERDREKRRRRAARLDAMRETVAALESALPVVLTLDDNDDGDDDDSVLWEEILDPKAMRVRHLMRKAIALTKEAQRLTSSRNQLKRLLREHQVASLVLAGMSARNNPLEDWKADVYRWQTIVHKYYKPRTMEECQEMMEAALKEVNAFQWSTEKQSTGVSFMGWRDARRVDHARGAFQFEFEKTFRSYDMEDHVKIGWATYTDASTFYEVIIGPRARVVDGFAIGDRVRSHHEILQELTPSIVLVLDVEQYPDAAMDAHVVYLVFRVETERGYIQCMRSVFCAELMKAIDEPRAVWPSNSIWLVWDRLDGDDNAYTLRIGGSLNGNDAYYLTQWMFEALGSVLRCERKLTGRQLITND